MRPRVFPAEDSLGLTISARAPSGFNEAAGIPRGRPAALSQVQWGIVRFNEAAGIPRGRRIVAEQEENHDASASMRPRVFPAEDTHPLHLRPQYREASMRPRVFPAEDVSL